MASKIATLVEAVAAAVALEFFELQVVADVVEHVGQAVRLVNPADQARQLLLRSASLLIHSQLASVVTLHVWLIVLGSDRLNIALTMIR